MLVDFLEIQLIIFSFSICALYFIHSTLVLSIFIDVVLTLFMTNGTYSTHHVAYIGFAFCCVYCGLLLIGFIVTH